MKTNILYWIILALFCYSVIISFTLLVSRRNNRWLNKKLAAYDFKYESFMPLEIKDYGELQPYETVSDSMIKQ